MIDVNFKEVIALLNKGYSLADIAGLTSEHLEALYALAYQYYQVGSYTEAKNIFSALCLYDCHEIKFFMGLGASLQALGEYQKAADTYSVACTLSGLVDTKSMYFAAICLLKINKKDEAIAALEAIAHMGQEHNAQDEQYKLKALNLLSVIKG